MGQRHDGKTRKKLWGRKTPKIYEREIGKGVPIKHEKSWRWSNPSESRGDQVRRGVKSDQ